MTTCYPILYKAARLKTLQPYWQLLKHSKKLFQKRKEMKHPYNKTLTTSANKKTALQLQRDFRWKAIRLASCKEESSTLAFSLASKSLCIACSSSQHRGFEVSVPQLLGVMKTANPGSFTCCFCSSCCSCSSSSSSCSSLFCCFCWSAKSLISHSR